MKYSFAELARVSQDSLDPQNLSRLAKTLWLELQKQKKFSQLDRLLRLIDEEKAKRDGKIIVKVTSAQKLDEQMKLDIKKKIESKTGLKTEASFLEDQSILGGLKIKIQDEVLDLSWRGKLEKIKQMTEDANE
ncbi:MAG: F0F1 ATP synthase subunit delta [bacterium]